MTTTQTNLACNLNAHTPEQRARHRELLAGILVKQLEAHEQANGYTITLPAEITLIAEVAEYISLERLCCPGLRLSLTCEANHGPLVLEISGTDGPALWATLQAAIQE
jgi:hypothetical protein